MIIAKVEGNLWATRKEETLVGRKLMIVRPSTLAGETTGESFVAVDAVDAGIGEMVMFCQGSSARLAPGMKDAPVDAVIIGIVDSVDVLGKQIFSGKA